MVTLARLSRLRRRSRRAPQRTWRPVASCSHSNADAAWESHKHANVGSGRRLTDRLRTHCECQCASHARLTPVPALNGRASARYDSLADAHSKVLNSQMLCRSPWRDLATGEMLDTTNVALSAWRWSPRLYLKLSVPAFRTDMVCFPANMAHTRHPAQRRRAARRFDVQGAPSRVLRGPVQLSRDCHGAIAFRIGAPMAWRPARATTI